MDEQEALHASRLSLWLQRGGDVGLHARSVIPGLATCRRLRQRAAGIPLEPLAQLVVNQNYQIAARACGRSDRGACGHWLDRSGLPHGTADTEWLTTRIASGKVVR